MEPKYCMESLLTIKKQNKTKQTIKKKKRTKQTNKNQHEERKSAFASLFTFLELTSHAFHSAFMRLQLCNSYPNPKLIYAKLKFQQN